LLANQAMRWKANVTVAAVIEKDGRFLMIEESIDGQKVINQPAGHLERNESLLNAVNREVLEETAWEFEPEKIVGIYLYPGPNTEITFLRICFSGSSFQHYPDQKLDEGIIQVLWMSRKELDQRKENLRSPLVTNCIDDYLKGQKYSLDLLHHYEA
jgi:8-oxo-dGTP pyrophosphatase MutT (NUDIX family)